MPRRSKYVLLVDNVSSVTASKDIEREFSFAGKIRDVMKDSKYRCALVEFDRSADAHYAWRKMDGFRMDGRQWKVEYATKDDFKFFGWKWFEHSPSPSRSRSRSPSPPPKKDTHTQPKKSEGDGRSPPPDTPFNNDDRHDVSE